MKTVGIAKVHVSRPGDKKGTLNEHLDGFNIFRARKYKK